MIDFQGMGYYFVEFCALYGYGDVLALLGRFPQQTRLIFDNACHSENWETSLMGWTTCTSTSSFPIPGAGPIIFAQKPKTFKICRLIKCCRISAGFELPLTLSARKLKRWVGAPFTLACSIYTVIQLLEYKITSVCLSQKIRMVISRNRKELSEFRWWQNHQIFGAFSYFWRNKSEITEKMQNFV